MSDERVICTECGKDVRADLPACEECGARNFHGRPVRSKLRKGQERQDTKVTALVDAVSVAPRTPAHNTATGGRHRKNRDKHVASRSSHRSSRRLPSVHSSTPRYAQSPAEALADDSGEPRRLSRRKVYRYDKSDRPKFKYASELRAVIFILIAGVVLVLMCRMADVDATAAPAPPAVSRSAGLPTTSPAGTPHMQDGRAPAAKSTPVPSHE